MTEAVSGLPVEGCTDQYKRALNKLENFIELTSLIL